MNKIMKIGIGLFLLLLLGGFAWLVMVDVPVQQKEIIKTISNERFFE